MRRVLLIAVAALAVLPACARADTRVTIAGGELRVVNEDAGVANKLVAEYAEHAGEATIRLFDEADPAGISTYPTPPCSPGRINTRGNPVELFCTRSAIRSVSIDVGPNEDAVTAGLDQTPVVVTGALGTDTLVTGAAADVVAGDQGNDTLESGAGDDDVRGEDGADTIRAGDGNDKVLGGAGADAIDAGPGDDTVTAADGVADKIDCGAGTDTAVVDEADQPVGCETVDRRHVDAPAGAPAATDDHTRPLLQAGGLSTQRVGKRVAAIRIRATTSEPGVVQVTGYLVAGGINDRLRPAAGTVTVAGGGVEVALPLSRTQLRRIVRDLRRHRRPRVRITVSSVDAAGNTSRARHMWIALRR